MFVLYLRKRVHDGTKTNCKKMWQFPGRKLDGRFFFHFPLWTLKLNYFWRGGDETPCSLLNRRQSFWGICSLHLQGRSVNSLEFLETLVSMYQTTRRHITEVLYFYIHHHVKVKSKINGASPCRLHGLAPLNLCIL